MDALPPFGGMPPLPRRTEFKRFWRPVARRGSHSVRLLTRGACATPLTWHAAQFCKKISRPEDLSDATAIPSRGPNENIHNISGERTSRILNAASPIVICASSRTLIGTVHLKDEIFQISRKNRTMDIFRRTMCFCNFHAPYAGSTPRNLREYFHGAPAKS